MARAPVEMAAQEDLPESDRLADFPHPRHSMDIFGHDQAQKIFATSLQSGRLHHAWLLTGPEGIGKATFAYHCTRHLLGKSGAGDIQGQQSDRLVAGLVHPRLLLIRRPYDPKTKKFTASIPVDEVRRLRPFVGKTAEAGSWRVVLIDNANELNVSAANALLKVLEEPPRQTVFFLIAPEPGRLLATIRSRCRALALEPVTGDAFARAMQHAWSGRDEPATADLSSDRLAHLAAISGGSVRRALVLADNDGEVLFQRVVALFEQLPDIDWVKVRTLAEELSVPGQDGQFHLVLELVLQKIAALAKARATDNGHQVDLDQARRLISDPMVASWAELWETIARQKAETQALNLDRKSLILSVFSGLSKNATPEMSR